jgi:FdhD protein
MRNDAKNGTARGAAVSADDVSLLRLAARVPVRRLKGDESLADMDLVAREVSVLLRIGRFDLVRLQCSPDRLEDLAAGFLCSVGFIRAGERMPEILIETGNREAVLNVACEVSEEEILRFRRNLSAGTGCGLALFDFRGADPFDCRRKIDTAFRFGAEALRGAMAEFQRRSVVYRETGGVHAAAVASGNGLEAFAEDVGRHNAVDKAIGFCLKRDVPLGDKALLSTGRLSLDLVSKCVRAGVPVLASRSAPTDAAVELARLSQLTVVGFLRGSRMNIYSSEWRIE